MIHNLKIDLHRDGPEISEDLDIIIDIENFKSFMSVNILHLKPNLKRDVDLYWQIDRFINELRCYKYNQFMGLEYKKEFYNIRSKYKKAKRKKLYVGEYRKHCLFSLFYKGQELKIDTREFIK